MTQINITPDRLLDLLDEELSDNVEVGFKTVSNNHPKRYEPIFEIIRSDNEFWERRADESSQADIERHLRDSALEQGYLPEPESDRDADENLKYYCTLAVNTYVQNRFKEYKEAHGEGDELM